MMIPFRCSEFRNFDRRSELFAALLLGVLSLSSSVAAAVGAAGIDLVIAIDQSGSMSGFREKDGTWVQNDPQGNRVGILHSPLWSGMLQEQARQGYTSRISVVEFGSRDRCPTLRSKNCPQVTLSQFILFPVSPGRGLAKIRQEWKAAISRIRAISRGDTDHPRALDLVRRELLDFAKKHVTSSGKSGPRKPLVLLITDGETDVPNMPGVTKLQLREETRQAVEKIKQMSPADLNLIVVGITDPKTGYWKYGCGEPGGCEAFWRELATPDENGLGQAYSAENEASPIPGGRLPARLDEVLSTLTDSDGSAGPCGQDQQNVPPYLRALHIQVDFDRIGLPLAELDIRDPQGQRLMPGPGDRPTATGVAFDVAYPQPGLWKLRNANARYQVCLNYELEQAQLIEPPSPLVQGKEMSIRYRLEGRGPNHLFEEQAGFPLRFSVAIKSPRGAESTLDLQSDPDHPGEVVSTAKYAFRDTGEYRLKLEGQSRGKEFFTVYHSADQDGDSVKVEPGTPVRLRLDVPASGEVLISTFGRATVPVRMVFVDAQEGTVLAPGSVLEPGTTPGLQWVIENATQPDMSPVVRATVAEDRLEVSLDLDSGEFLNYLVTPGSVRLSVQPLEFASGIYYQGVEGGDDWYSAPFPFRECRLVLVLFVLVPVALFALIVWALWYWGGAWYIRRQDRRDRLKPRLLLQFPDHPDFNQPWSISPRRRTHPTPNKVMLPDQSEWTIQDFRIHRRYTPGAVSIRLRYRPPPDPDTKQRAAIEKADLRATDDNALRAEAKHRVKGLGAEEAYFVLLAGKNGEGNW